MISVGTTVRAYPLHLRPPFRASRWLSVVTHIDPRYGGLSSVVPQLASVISAAGRFNVSMAAFCLPDEANVSLDDLEVTQFPASRRPWLRSSMKGRELQTRFDRLLDGVDGLHIHGLWEQSTLVAVRAARVHERPYVLSAHGMLEPWALANKRLKKLAYSALFERATVAGASCLHALTRAEAEDYRRYGAEGPIAIIPNGVEIPKRLSPELFIAQNPQLRGARIALFLGRIHFKKGLDLLVRAWKPIASRHSDARLVLAGPDFEGTQAMLQRLIEQEGVSDSVLFTGMLGEEMKWSALAAAECFVLPSYSEGLSVSALEAMGAGLPVILSEHCHLPEVAAREAGWVVSAEIPALQQATEEVFSNSSQTNRTIGARGRDLVKDRYEWATIARQMGEVYAWVHGGEAPASVEMITAGGRR